MSHHAKAHGRRNLRQRYHQDIDQNALDLLARSARGRVEPRAKLGASDDVILRGRLTNNVCRSNLNVHVTDAVEVKDYVAAAIVSPHVTVSLVLAGSVRGRFDEVPFELDGQAKPTGYFWSVTKPARFERTIVKDMLVRKVNISANHDWLMEQLADASPTDQRLLELVRQNLKFTRWAPSKRAISLAEQILTAPRCSPLIQNLYMESRALEIFSEALVSLAGDPVGHVIETSTADQWKVQRIRGFIEDHWNDDLTLAFLSKELGMSTGSLQKLFKAAYGTTIIDYIRELRLTKAREAMDRDGMTISQAAHLAGYGNAANFSTAFKRLFGVSPSAVRG